LTNNFIKLKFNPMKKLVTPLLKKISILALLTLSLLTLSNCRKNLQEQTKPESNLVTRQISEQSAKLSKQDELLLDSIYNSYEYSKIAEITNKTQAFIAKMQEYTDKNFDKKQSKYRTSKQDFDDNLNL
ncbi:MAG: hypothetical protein KKG25_10560, partial [Bacteroidetes bacterium]|nr:hypothetical protein [Bacteroidota bacterium]MBU1485284.1 hypothetical protein [Bacteroidota bacterium]MBU2374988.1 hypothetical protein [Bacteroidota bacterium]